ncbi:MAG: aminodeoxychorismate/anthranilate synthase component II, partial [Chloroflexota bacterium]
MILIIDNYDSFTYNIVQELGELGAEMTVWRNDQVTLDDIRELNPSHIIISPGPGFPKDAGISCDVIREFGATIPLLGICLGHQCIGEVYGGKVVHAPTLMHGKTSQINHRGDSLFADVEETFTATRYHSLVVQPETLPDVLEVIATAETGEIMGVRHKE